MLVHVWAILLLGAAQFLPPIHAMKKNKNDEALDGIGAELKITDPKLQSQIEEDHLLHVVILAPEFVIDEDGSGKAQVVMDGTGSHTHEPGVTVTKYEWTLGMKGKVISKAQKFEYNLTSKKKTICLTIFDDKGKKLSDCHKVALVDPCGIPGAELEYYVGNVGLAAVGGQPDSTELSKEYGIETPSLTPPYVVRMRGSINIRKQLNFGFSKPGLPHEFRVNGQVVKLPSKKFTAGTYKIELRVKVTDFDDFPFKLTKGNKKNINPKWFKVDNGCGDDPDDPDDPGNGGGKSITINSITPSKGPVAGGAQVTAQTNVFNKAGAELVFNGKVLKSATFSTGKVVFTVPKGKAGPVDVLIRKGAVSSNVKTFTYLSGNPVFQSKTLAKGKFNVVEYCYGYLFTAQYGGTNAGLIEQWEVLDDYKLKKVKSITAVKNANNIEGANSVLGLVCDPFMNENNFDVYINHSKLFQTGQFNQFPIPGNNFVSYKGYVSKINVSGGGSKVSGLKVMISGLPVSNRDHGINGGVFLDDGTYLFTCGGMTNAGYPGVNLGGLPESALSAAVLQAKIRGSGFPVDIKYKFISGQKPKNYPGNANPNNAIYGDAVEPIQKQVTTYATGLRNPYDCTVKQDKTVVCTDNGPNRGNYGVPQTGCKVTSGVLDYQLGPAFKEKDKDEVIFVKKGAYYGSPNMARVRKAGKCTVEGVYRRPGAAGGGVSPTQSTHLSSIDGIIEFVSHVYNGAERGNLFACNFKQKMIILNPQGKKIDEEGNFSCLDITAGPGGALYAADLNQGNVLRVRYPANPVGAVDCFPHRAKGGVKFIISGGGFGTKGAAKVTFGGKAASQVKVESGSRITGKTPSVKGLVDVKVTVGGQTWTIPKGFKGL